MASIDGDGKLVAGFPSLFCTVQPLAEGEEEAVFASLGARSSGTCRIYATHQDEFEEFRDGARAHAIASWIYGPLQKRESWVKKRPDLLHAARQAFDKEPAGLSPHLESGSKNAPAFHAEALREFQGENP